MEHEYDAVKLSLDDENSLVFEVRIEGETPASSPVYRMVCEAGRGMHYAFSGDVVDGSSVRFIVPPLQGMLKEGSYDSHLEVIIDSKLLVPLQFKTNFIVPTRIQIEGVKVGNDAATASRPAARLLRVEGKGDITENKVSQQAMRPARVASENKQAPKKHVTLREMYENRGVGKPRM